MAWTTAAWKMINYIHKPEDVAYSYTELSKVGRSFGSSRRILEMYTACSPGNVELRPIILKNSQDHIEKTLKTGPKTRLLPSSMAVAAAPSTRSAKR